MPRAKTYRKRHKPTATSRAGNDCCHRRSTPTYTENDLRTRPPPPAHLTGPQRPVRDVMAEALAHTGRGADGEMIKPAQIRGDA